MFFQNPLKKQLIEGYATMITSLMGVSDEEARKIAKKLLVVAQQKVKEQGLDRLPPNFGDIILSKEKENPAFMNINLKREDGVTNEDIRWFWNLPPLEKGMLEAFDEWIRLTAFATHKDQGMSSDKSAERVRKFHPIFGDPKDTKHTSGDDRPLPVELKDRINKWVITKMSNPEEHKKRMEEYSTMNAFIRAEIGAGNI